jgi:glycosyltransferase involved in cell wall biosynthesis
LADFELIVVEDPSARSAREMLSAWDDSRIRYVGHERRTSFVTQLNRGLAEARAALVARLDADDVAEPERLQAQADYLRRHPEVAVVGSQIRIIDEQGQDRGHRAYPLEHEQIVRSLRRFNPFAHPGVMYRKDLVLQVGGYQCPQYHPAEDYELWSRMAVHGMRFANLSTALLRYRIHVRATKTSRLRDTLRHTLAVKNMYWRGAMDWRDRARFWGERLLLLLPPAVVLRLFAWHEYRKTPVRRPA